MAAFMARADIDVVHVPYKGGRALVAGVLGGQVQAGWSGIPNVAPHIRAGKLRVYAISTAQRSAMLPDVPTVAELGFPGFDIATVIGLQAPAGTPREIVGRLQAAVAKALRERAVADRMANLGMDLMENGTEHYTRFLKDDLERYAMAVKAAGMKNEYPRSHPYRRGRQPAAPGAVERGAARAGDRQARRRRICPRGAGVR